MNERRDVKTVDVRLLVAADVDVEYLTRQLVFVARGPGAPLGAVRVMLWSDSGTEADVVVDDDPRTRISTRAETSWWNDEQVWPPTT